MKCQEAAASVQRTARLGPYCCEAYRRNGCRPPIGKQKDRHCDPMRKNIAIEETTWQRDQLLEPKRDSENHLLLWSLQKDCRPPISDKVWPRWGLRNAQVAWLMWNVNSAGHQANCDERAMHFLSEVRLLPVNGSSKDTLDHCCYADSQGDLWVGHLPYPPRSRSHVLASLTFACGKIHRQAESAPGTKQYKEAKRLSSLPNG